MFQVIRQGEESTCLRTLEVGYRLGEYAGAAAQAAPINTIWV
jgi:hypothetical protein